MPLQRFVGLVLAGDPEPGSRDLIGASTTPPRVFSAALLGSGGLGIVGSERKLGTWQSRIEPWCCGQWGRHPLRYPCCGGADAADRLLGPVEFRANPVGHEQLVALTASLRSDRSGGMEGTGSYGAELTRHLLGAGIDVVEVNHPNR